MAMQKVQEEAETTLGMLAFDAFPRFLKSKYCNAVMDDLKQASNPNEVCDHFPGSYRGLIRHTCANELATAAGTYGYKLLNERGLLTVGRRYVFVINVCFAGIS